MPGLRPGKFRSMLIDIFGRAYPEKKFFMVDRDAVTRYKARVHRNVAQGRRAHRRHPAQRRGRRLKSLNDIYFLRADRPI